MSLQCQEKAKKVISGQHTVCLMRLDLLICRVREFKMQKGLYLEHLRSCNKKATPVGREEIEAQRG